MKITAATVRDFKRIRDVKITPDADRYLVLIAGNNGQGKSSLLDALTLALGGKRAQPADPVRHGAERAVIEVGFDNGYQITRTIQPDGESKLIVRGPEGVIAKPQALLDRLVGERFLDPLAFLGTAAKEQRRILLEVTGVDVTGLDQTRDKAFTKRTEVGRDLAKAKADLERVPAPTPHDGDPPRPAAEVATALGELVRAIDAARAHAGQVDTLSRDIERKGARIDEVRAELAKLIDDRLAACAQLERVRESATAAPMVIADLDAQRTRLRDELAAGEAYTKWKAGADLLAARRKMAQEEVDKLSTHHGKLNEVVAEMDQKKAAALAKAVMPVADLSFTDEGIALGGVPFDQASQSERLRCALAIAMRLSPNLRDVWVRDGSLLDETSLAILAELAETVDCRLWVERVGESDEGAIIIRDGALIEALA